MTKVQVTIDSDKIAKKMLDFIIGCSGFSAIIIYGLIYFDKINDIYIKYVFMPGYILMMIFMIFLRMVCASRINQRKTNKGDDDNG